MNNLQIFKNEKFGEMRTTEINNIPYVCLVDICKMLEIKNVSDCKTRLNQDGVVTTEVGVQTGYKKDGTPAIQMINMTFINESNLYKVIFQSRKPEAEKFTEWVTGEVLPTLRKEGTYTVKKKHKPIDKAIKQHFNIAETIINATGIKPELVYCVAISEAEKETGYKYEEYKKLLPSAEHDVASYNPTQIGELLGHIKAQEVNKRLERLGLQEKKGKVWRITQQGKKYGEEKPYSRNGHTDYRIVWREKVLKELGGKKDV